jgi:hypothetical protein
MAAFVIYSGNLHSASSAARVTANFRPLTSSNTWTASNGLSAADPPSLITRLHVAGLSTAATANLVTSNYEIQLILWRSEP